MITVNIQISEQGKRWEEIPSKELSFKDNIEIAVFAYRLALVTGREIRVSNTFGNGSYYHPSNAAEYLKELL